MRNGRYSGTIASLRAFLSPPRPYGERGQEAKEREVEGEVGVGVGRRVSEGARVVGAIVAVQAKEVTL